MTSFGSLFEKAHWTPAQVVTTLGAGQTLKDRNVDVGPRGLSKQMPMYVTSSVP
jgi:hypothetical protein